MQLLSWKAASACQAASLVLGADHIWICCLRQGWIAKQAFPWWRYQQVP